MTFYPEDRAIQGTISTYVNHFCRCEMCRGAWATYNRELRRRRRDALGA